MEIIQQNQHDRPRPTRQLCRGKSYRLKIEDLLTDCGELDTSMSKWCEHRRDDGAILFLSSDHGKGHAQLEARRMGVESLFSW